MMPMRIKSTEGRVGKCNARTKASEASDRSGWRETSGRLGCGIWIKSSGIYYGLVSKPSGRRCHGFLQQGTARGPRVRWAD
jgi:hypothetical protein